jgi:cation transport ATPase
MVKLILASVAVLAMSAVARAEDKTCNVKGMHCESCSEMVQGKVCDQAKYSTCDVKIVNEKKELGQIHLITKDATAKINEKIVSEAVKDAGYEMQKCKTSKAKKI